MPSKTYAAMRFITLALCLMFIAALVSKEAQAQSSRVYFAGYMGLTTTPDNDFSESNSAESGDYQTNNSVNFAGAIGVRLNRRIRFEGELSYRKNDLSKLKGRSAIYSSGGEIENLSLFLNGYYDFGQFKWKAKPFVMAGLGAMRLSTSFEPGSGLSEADADKTVLGWTLGTGLKYRVNPGLAFTGAYRYIGADDFSMSSYDVDYSAHEFRIGLEYDLHWK